MPNCETFLFQPYLSNSNAEQMLKAKNSLQNSIAAIPVPAEMCIMEVT